MGNLKKKRRLKMNQHKRRKRLKSNRHKKRSQIKKADFVRVRRVENDFGLKSAWSPVPC